MLHKKSKMVAVDCNRNSITCQAFVYSGNTAFFIEWVDIIRVLYFLDDNTTRLCILVNMYGRGSIEILSSLGSLTIFLLKNPCLFNKRNVFTFRQLGYILSFGNQFICLTELSGNRPFRKVRNVPDNKIYGLGVYFFPKIRANIL